MPLFTDQIGRTISLDHPPKRIISLVPSQTELLYTLGLEEEVIGITKFCVHPQQWFRLKTRVGGTKDIRPEIIHKLQPDLIIANKEENDRTQIEQLFPLYPVWVSDVATLAAALQMIRAIGEITGKTQPAGSLADEIALRFAALKTPATKAGAGTTPSQPSLEERPSRRTAYFIWKTPWMAAGGDTFIQDMLTHAGLTNIFQDQCRYPSIELSSLSDSGCELVLLSSEPYPFREKHIQEIKAVVPQATIRLVDGEVFSWYGSRLLQAPDYLGHLLEDLPNQINQGAE